MTQQTFSTKRSVIEEKETIIINAATKIFLLNGLSGTKIADIAKESGIAEGTLYLYFKNKDALMSAVVSAHWDRITIGAINSIKNTEGCINKLTKHAQYHVKTLLEEWSLIELSFVLHYSGKSDESEVAKYKRKYMTTFDKIISQGIDSREINHKIPVTFIRDFFYGTLEFCARTVNFKHKSKHTAEINKSIDKIVNHLTLVLQDGFLSKTRVHKPNQDISDLVKLESKLDQLIAKLEKRI